MNLSDILGQPMSAYEIAECFNTASKRTFWKANIHTQGKPRVIFQDKRGGMVKFIFIPQDDIWYVEFKQAVAAFGHYANAIAKGYVSILQALQSGGAPVVAPEGLEGVEIVIRHSSVGNAVTVRLATNPVTNFLVDIPETAVSTD